MKKTNNNIITALDIGSTKTVCFIARVKENNDIQNTQIIGIGHQISKGIKSGIITNIKLAEDSIRQAVGAAEQMAGTNIDKVAVNISGCKQKSHNIRAQLQINGQEISRKDITRMIEKVCNEFEDRDMEVIHCFPIEYEIDGNRWIKDPVGMVGQELQISLHIITVSSSALTNIETCLARCHLDIQDYVISSYASALACLEDDDMKLGTILLDIGGGNSSIAVFEDSNLIFIDAVNIGGIHITNDIAVGLSIDIANAERIKNLYGNVVLTVKDEHQLIDIPQLNENGMEETSTIEKSILVGIIRPRIEEILELVKIRVNKAGVEIAGKRIILTGGVSQLTGLKDFIAQSFDAKVKIGIPTNMPGMADSMCNASFASCTGIIKFSLQRLRNETHVYTNNQLKNISSHFFKWLQRNF